MADEEAPDIQADSVGQTACPECRHIVDVSGVEAFSIVECPGCHAKFAAPGKLAQFVLLKLLGQGEMGATFRAFEKALGRYVAVKVMRKSLLEDKERVEAFFAEARALASLDHPNVARAYSVGQEKGQPYIVMELITGKRLDQLYSLTEPLEEVRALEVATGVARALQAANEIGLIHGDVKPANIMLDEKGRARLVDFGIARFGGGRIREGAPLGTPYYVAPEQVTRQSVDYRTDIYSLGATLFHALACWPPFPGKTMKEVLLAKLEKPAPDLLEARPSLHEQTASVVARMLQTKPADRYGSYEELLVDLEQACRAAAGEVQGDESPAGPGRAKRRWPVLAGAAALLVAVVVGAIVWPRGNNVLPVSHTGPIVSTRPASRPTLVERKVSAPVFSPPGRTIADPVAVAITCDTTDARIYYTTDGSEPTASSSRYTKSVTVKPGTTLRARAYRQGYKPSPIVEATYARDSVVVTDVVHIRTRANQAWARVRRFSGGQGFKAKLDQCSAIRTNAETFFKLGDYPKAKASYAKLIEECGKLEELENERKLAGQDRNRAVGAVRVLEQIKAPREPGTPWHKATQANEAAQKAFDKGDFAKATELWKLTFKEANVGRTLQVDKIKAAYEAELNKNDVEKLKRYGGNEWREVEKAVAAAEREAEAGRLLQAAAQYKRARQLLPRAVAVARTGENAAKINVIVARARKLLADKQYHEAMKEVNAALKLNSRYHEAIAIRNKIRAHLFLSLDLGRGARIKLTLIPAGKFTMGSPTGEKGRAPGFRERQHEVTISKPFHIATHEVSVRQFRAFWEDRLGEMTPIVRKWFNAKLRVLSGYGIDGRKWTRIKPILWSNPRFPLDYRQKEPEPVVCVAWSDAVEFCKWMGEKTGMKVRLPTETEWEYACRAGTKTRFHFGNDDGNLHKHGNYLDNSLKISGRDKDHSDGFPLTAEVGKYQPNPWGLYDMHGNVREWCLDRMGPYPARSVTDPTGVRTGELRVVRGGSWHEPPKSCRSAARASHPRDYRSQDVGFRVVAFPKE